ncbi:hypothetical protein FB451DRAFT_772 [Mycena latifolia]|nr:hypothetical protein FB451DRAFT_772 [Mycena latifolia]
MSSQSSSSSSSSSSSRSSTSELPAKRKREAEDDSDSENDSSNDSDAEAAPEVPVLSHAEQRRQKRKEKQEKLAQDQPAKKRKLPDGSAASAGAPSKRQNSVWVGNLTFKTTTEALTEFFKDAGEITRIHMPTKASTAPGVKAENRGYAYVDFKTEEGKKAAIALSEQNLFGRRLLIKDGGDFTGRPAVPGTEATAANGSEPSKTHSKTAQKILRAQKQPPAPTLFLGNLGFETTDQSIRELFEAHRPVKKKVKTEDGEEQPEADKGRSGYGKFGWARSKTAGRARGAFFSRASHRHILTVPSFAFRRLHLHRARDGRPHQSQKLHVELVGSSWSNSPQADAVRRGAPKGKREDGGADRMPQRRKEAKSRGPRAEKKLEREKEAGDAPAFSAPRAASDNTAPSSKPYGSRDTDSGGGTRERKGPKNRPKPGAALALAKRESAAIVPSQGKKVVF